MSTAEEGRFRMTASARGGVYARRNPSIVVDPARDQSEKVQTQVHSVLCLNP